MKLNIKKPVLIFAVLILVGLVCNTCIDTFNTGSGSGQELLCVDASLVKNIDVQKVILTHSYHSKSDSVEYVGGCTVYVEDENGETRYYSEDSTGVYTAQIEDPYLVFHKKYRLHIETGDGAQYLSEYEELIPCPPVDSVYTCEEEAFSLSRNEIWPLLQFYVDIKADSNYSRYYRWTMEEDFEYQVPYPYAGYYDETGLHINYYPTGHPYLSIDTLQTCYMHRIVKGLYASNTAKLSVNEKKKIPINYKYSGAIEVSRKYSLLVKQYSLTENAYTYWKQKQAEIQESANLYLTQPGSLCTNFKNLNDDNEKVLGFFWAGTVNEKRIFYSHSFGLHTFNKCQLEAITDTFFYIPYPVYFLVNESFRKFTADRKCFDCRYHGGTLDPPDFWNDTTKFN